MANAYEPTFCIHIEFADGSNPMLYYDLLQDAAFDVLKQWSKNYILTPLKYTADGEYRMMNWRAEAKEKLMPFYEGPPEPFVERRRAI